MTQPESLPDLERADRDAGLHAASWRDHPAVQAASLFCELADQPPMFATSAALLVGGLASDRPRLAEAGARMLLAVAAVTLVKTAIKASVTRTRPNVVLEEGRYESRLGGGADGPDASFPSGHTGNAVAAARAVARVFPEGRVPLYAAAAVASAVQVPRGAHYPADVAAGVLLGLAAEAAVDRAWPHLMQGLDSVAEALGSEAA
ncbi:phosphatase PAP2 family protein [Rubellimicrobium sp. CFH 75288]|uniref:phosphatase PAP2 family protein n=1 Tax=Rubellimicrobium sp. CFH 75288 TaxID=2697034 RepID=UPI001412552F|nr:phosphatase PAP2 family protein [Rubellimicrobium sp. CFH 75288]NAZ38136.1 phosphatase PAP2 family protein [Rubellimicrobium sp. CFH 75288]